MLEVVHLSKRYGAHTAVKDLSFTMEKGKIYGLLGPNGAGKSTTMNMMTGYLAPDGGDVTLDGVSLFSAPEKVKREIGYLPEIPPLYKEMTVREYLRFVAGVKRVEKGTRNGRISRVLQMTQTVPYADRLIRSLSKGYQQRVGIAQALIGMPQVLILDEPTAGLDPQQIMETRRLIEELRSEHAVLLSSHILSEVSAVCDEILILSHGELVATGTPAELEERYRKDAQLHFAVSLSADADEETVREAVLSAVRLLPGVADVGFREEEISAATLEQIFLRVTKEAAEAEEAAEVTEEAEWGEAEAAEEAEVTDAAEHGEAEAEVTDADAAEPGEAELKDAEPADAEPADAADPGEAEAAEEEETEAAEPETANAPDGTTETEDLK